MSIHESTQDTFTLKESSENSWSRSSFEIYPSETKEGKMTVMVGGGQEYGFMDFDVEDMHLLRDWLNSWLKDK